MSVLVLDEAQPVARKEHFCEVCLGRIGAGDKYVRQRNVSDGEAYTFKAHRLCWAISLRLHREQEMWEDEWPEPDEVRQELLALFAALATPYTDGGKPVNAKPTDAGESTALVLGRTEGDR